MRQAVAVLGLFGGVGVYMRGQVLVTNTGVPVALDPGGVVWCEGGWQNLAGGSFTNQGAVHISGDIRNDDPGQFFVSGPQPVTLILNGGQQTLSGQHPIRTDILRLGGTGPKILQTPLYVDRLLELGDAELHTRSVFVAVRDPDPAAITRNSGFVSSEPGGYLERATNSMADYLFPVGGINPSRYRPAYVTPTSSAPHRWAVRLANTDPNNENLPRSQRHPELCEINPLYYHIINRLSGGDPAHLTCVYDPSDPVKGPLTQWRSQASRWEPVGAVPGPFPSSWQVRSVTDFQAPSWAFSVPGFEVALTAPADTVEPGQPVSFTAITTPPAPNLTYNWQFGDGATGRSSPTLTHVYSEPGVYLVVVTARSPEGCEDSDSLRIVVDLPMGIFIPNAFSPNQDGVNDVWRPTIYGVRSVRWFIYDRWGVEIVRGEGPSASWDGTRGGQPCSEGVYTYLIETELFNGQKVRRAGTLSLLR